MSDLISRSALLQAMDKRYKEKKDIVPNNLAEGFAQMEKLIKEQSVAYDVDKVFEQLEHLLKNFGEHCEDWGGECNYKSCSDCVLSHAIEIVKGGGVNERD